MRDIKKGRINLILVTDLSRLSRNILDFCNLLKDLESYKSKFLSIKEQFDTSTPVGEMMIYNMVNLAQFERKQTSERVSLNCHARSLRGLMNGGPAILGYDKNPENTGTYIVNEEEAKKVRQIFEVFLEQGTLSKTIREIEALGIHPKGNPKRKNRLVNSGWWSVESLSSLLQHSAYIGMREVNRKYKNEDPSTLKPWQRYTVVKAAWPAIVKKETFERVQQVIEENKKLERARFAKGERRPFLLTGFPKCPECGRAMTPQSAHGQIHVHRYYTHSKKRGEIVNCKIKRISADDVEATVVKHLGTILQRAGYFEGIEKKIKDLHSGGRDQVNEEIHIAEKALKELDLEIRGAFKIQSAIDSNAESFKLVADQMEQLAQKRRDLCQRLERLKDLSLDDNGLSESLGHLKARLLEVERGWNKLTIAQKKRLLRRLLVRIEVHSDRIGIVYYMANGSEGAAKLNISSLPTVSPQTAAGPDNVIPLKNKRPTESNLPVQNLRVVNSGDLTRS